MLAQEYCNGLIMTQLIFMSITGCDGFGELVRLVVSQS